MGVDGPGADAERLAQLAVRETVRDESQDLDLATGQAIRPGPPRHGAVRDRHLETLSSMVHIALA